MRVLIIAVLVLIGSPSKDKAMGTISKNGMSVNWKYISERIFFEMKAPTTGWVAIGFNDNPLMTGSYLLMGNVIYGNAHLVEHYTESPGNYYPLTKIGVGESVDHISGQETSTHTILKFSLPIKPNNKYSRILENGMIYNMHMAYSRDDDFQHHSTMRTTIKVEL